MIIADLDVKALREELGLTQVQLGERLGVDQSTVSHWEKGQRPRGPARRMLENILAEHRTTGATQ